MIIYGAIAFGLCWLVLHKGIRIVQTAEEHIVERFGKYHTTLTSGLHFINPIIDRVVGVVSLKHQNINTQIIVITKDDIRVNISCRVFFQITDSQKCFYSIGNLNSAIQSSIAIALRDYARVMKLEELTFYNDKVNYRVSEELQNAIGQWGCKVIKLEVLDFVQPSSTKNTMDNFYKEEEDVWVG